MMLIVSAIVFTVLYLFLIVIFSNGWKRLPHQDFNNDFKVDLSFPVTVIIPLKNEEQNLDQLLVALEGQAYKPFTTVFVDDHSSDNSKLKIKAFQVKFSNVIVISAIGYGKKNALREGINVSEDGLIITTDADCVPVYTWLENIVLFQQKQQCDLIIGPVKMVHQQSLFSKLQQLEFASLVASGAGAAGAGMPIMCNGANLAFKKEAWLQSHHDLRNETASGDDMFLLQSIKKRKGKIKFLKSTKAMVETQTVEGLHAFWKQRKRWASKSTKYTDSQIIYVAIIVFVVSLLQICLLVAGALNAEYWWYLCGIFILKYLADYFLLNKVSPFFGLKQVAIQSLILSLIYPIYILMAAFGGFFHPKNKW